MSDTKSSFQNLVLKYEKGENRYRHCGQNSNAEMVFENGNNWVGKCPKNFSSIKALELLQNGIPEFRNSITENPYRFWIYYDGVVYAARSQDGGTTWHGFPNGHPMPSPPRIVLKQLEQRARDLGEYARLTAWLSKKWNTKS